MTRTYPETTARIVRAKEVLVTGLNDAIGRNIATDRAEHARAVVFGEEEGRNIATDRAERARAGVFGEEKRDKNLPGLDRTWRWWRAASWGVVRIRKVPESLRSMCPLLMVKRNIVHGAPMKARRKSEAARPAESEKLAPPLRMPIGKTDTSSVFRMFHQCETVTIKAATT